MEIPKLCLFCEHFYFSPSTRGYSEYTPGSELEMFCVMSKWDIDDDYLAIKDVFLLAETCELYRINEWAKERYMK